MPDEIQPNLITPNGLNYECTGCGKCCSGWSVPMTEQDYQRIVAIDWSSLDPSLKNKELFRPLTEQQKSNTPYTHAINATAEGQCPFLKNNLCFIHSQFDAKTKPSMCQLFPYSFNETPSGIYTSVSFVSRGAIFNAGVALSDQKEYLQLKYKEFKKLFAGHVPNWSQIKLSTDKPLSWDEYLNIENQLLTQLKDKNKNIENRFIDACTYLNTLLSGPAKPNINQSLNQLDKIILAWLYNTYFPEKGNRTQGYGNLNFTFMGILNEFFKSLFMNSRTFSYQSACQLISLPWTDNIEDNDIIYRFFYSHIFGKHYFGAGLGQLSLITGFHHLALLLVLIKLRARKLAADRSDSKINQMDIVQTIVQLEKSLGELKITPQGATLLELLLASPSRVTRILDFAH